MSRRTPPTLANRIAVIVASIALLVGIASMPDSAEAATSNGWTTTASTSATSIRPGSALTLTITVSSTTTRAALIDVEVYTSSGKRFQKYWDNQSFTAGKSRQFTTTWTVPSNEPTVRHYVKIGVFGAGWNGLSHWNDSAATFAVTTTTTPPPTTTAPPTTAPPTTAPPTTAPPTTAPPTTAPPTTAPPTTAPPTTQPPTTPPTTAPPNTGHFSTLPPGAALPSDATCASRVRPAAEVRAVNTAANQTKGGPVSSLPGVTGNFTGTTDEIIQWVACKWGIDEDVVRAQIAKESWWHQDAKGDYTSNQNACHPQFRTGSGTCPESIGLGQVRYQYHGAAFTNDYTIRSSAFNLDYTYSRWRSCFNGNETWFNTVERGATYAAGDLWGCVGSWFSGRWHTPPSETYIAAVKDYLNSRIWESANFKNG